MTKYRNYIIVCFMLLAIGSAYSLKNLQFSFSFEDFFPQGDEDLAFFHEFVEDFEGDNNFMLVALVREEGVFDSVFLRKAHDFSLATRTLPHVLGVQSLTQFSYPIKTPFAITSIPAIHINQPHRYTADRERILQDERFVYNLINDDATALVIYLKTESAMSLEQANEHMTALEALVKNYDFTDVHMMGMAYFQRELVNMQKREVTFSATMSFFLVCFILWLIYRRFWGVFISMVSIGLGLLMFMGFLSVTGRELNALSALYPVLMIIVGTSDVIHIMSKYTDELRKGLSQKEAIKLTIQEIGLATFLTSVTTAIGFATLLTSKVDPIKDFGINAASGVMIAYVTILLFATAAMSFFKEEQLMKRGKGQKMWDNLIDKSYRFSLTGNRTILGGTVVLILLSAWGISRITTNYDIISNMPRKAQITADFTYFEKELAGFRPIEFAIFAQGEHKVTDFEVLKEIDKIENYLHQFPYVRAITSITAVYKTLNQMHANNRVDAYQLPVTETKYKQYHRLAEKTPKLNPTILVSKQGDKARITSRVLDIGADTIKFFGKKTDIWISENIDSSIIKVKRTGTGLLIDKNASYIRKSLLQGLCLAVIIVSFIMALLFQSWKMLIISLVPNFIPLLFAGALLGFLGIELDAGVSIVFAVIFGIAVDDSIHFLSKYKITRHKGAGVEEAILTTFKETGKAIVLTSLILFFCFLVMLFSDHPPSATIGMLISLTLLSAVVADLTLLPLMIRWLYLRKPKDTSKSRP